jgi:TorA maturation chaperone TorD
MADEMIPCELREALADDIETLAMLQDRELTANVLRGLKSVGFPDNLGLKPASDRARQAFDLLRGAVTALPADPAPLLLDQLAADYAAIYLNGSLGASPYESVWLSDDHTTCHDAMFQMREIYAATGLQAADWRRRPDDHLVLQLQFIAHCLRHPADRAGWERTCRVLDEHLLRWLDDFAGRVAARCDTAIYAGLVLLTAAYIDTLRDLLAQRLQQRRPTQAEVKERCDARRRVEAVAVAFVPGTGPSW